METRSISEDPTQLPIIAPDCPEGYKGECCCNCINLFELYKHPDNKIHKGCFTESSGMFAYIAGHVLENSYEGTIRDRKHGSCELHHRKFI